MPQRNWLITGVSSGSGRIMTEQLLARGDRLTGTVRNRSVMYDLQGQVITASPAIKWILGFPTTPLRHRRRGLRRSAAPVGPRVPCCRRPDQRLD
jgi:NAD(P)-dependent dehydrogenase (short-subunit alcohol dehydrogenase family)